ncbi:MAG TPA: Fic/DOC family N-terminal domain-containing protein [Thermoanaerobaculia bacterium]|jgi:hypothetical protein|nr:Fic/DOC family N-terminal domain-containing protein [Thermoanaerobaculia bacterium]
MDVRAGLLVQAELVGGGGDVEERPDQAIRDPAHGLPGLHPGALPYDPPLRYDNSLIAALSATDQELARLDAATEFLPNPDLFVRMYVRKEAVLFSQIEGTQASLVAYS